AVKKQILRTGLEGIIVTPDEASDTLSLVLHWAGGTHTSLTMPNPRSGEGAPTAVGGVVELIRRMAEGYGGGEVGRVVNRVGRRTGKGRRWSQERVATARRNHDIRGPTRAVPDPEILSLGGRRRNSGSVTRRSSAWSPAACSQWSRWRRGPRGRFAALTSMRT